MLLQIVLLQIPHSLANSLAQTLKFRIWAGHSLGGALATLAAYDIAHLLLEDGNRPIQQVYTFGAPRTGNHAFAEDFQASVPDCWHVINGGFFTQRKQTHTHIS